MVCHIGSVTPSSCSSSNFSKGWCPFAKILYSSKMGENYLPRAFFQPFYQNCSVWLRCSLGVFRGRQIRILWDNWARTIFFGGGGWLWTSFLYRTWPYLKNSWPYRLGDLTVVFLIWTVGKGCSFAKILKSSKIGDNAFTKAFFSAILLKSPDLDEMASMAVFEVVKFASVVKIDLGIFLGDQGIIFAPRLDLSWEWFAVQAR